DQEDRADDLAVLLGEPAALPLWVVALAERRHDAGDQRLELHIPAVFLCIEHTVAVDDPAHVAGSQVMAQRHALVGTGRHRLILTVLITPPGSRPPLRRRPAPPRRRARAGPTRRPRRSPRGRRPAP